MRAATSILALLSCLGCTASPECDAPSACPSGTTCIAGRCSAEDARVATDGGAADGGRTDVPVDGARPLDDATSAGAITISPTLYSTFFLRDGVAIGCGSNANGHLGVGDPFLDTYRRPAPLDVPAGTTFVQVVAGGHGGAALDASGHVWTWGDNMTGELGIGTVGTERADSPEPRALDADGAPFDHVVSIAVGYQFVGALKDDGSVWVWGLNGNDGTTDASGVAGRPIPAGACPWFGGGGLDCYVTAPSRVAFPAGTVIDELHASDFAMLAIDSEGQVWTWGGSAAADGSSTSTPTIRAGLPPIRTLAAGRGTTLALDFDGDVWTWSSFTPTRRLDDEPAFEPLAGRVTAVSLSGHAAHVIDVDGVLWGWGDNQVGEVGSGPPGIDVGSRDAAGCLNASYDYATRDVVAAPQRILDGVSAVFSSSFSYSVFALGRDGTVWAWGRNKVFNLCNDPPPLPDCATPVPHPDAYDVGVPVVIAPW